MSTESPTGFRVDHRTLSVLYVLALVVLIFGLWIPARFLTTDTAASILNNCAVSGMVALALLLPLAAGLFDFSIGYTLGLSSVLTAWLLGQAGLGTGESIVIAILASAGVGVLNGIVVVVFRIDSFIGTLATGSLLVAGNLMVSGNQILTKGVMTGNFTKVAQTNFGKLTIPVFYFVIVAMVLWFVMSHTALGRRLYATGLSIDAARLAGIRTDVIRFGSLVASATIAGACGVLVTAQIGAGSPDIGPPFLIPAYAAAFLGLAQSRLKLFNVWGTVAAVILTATTTAGLARAGAPVWAPYLFTGGVLIAAVGLSGLITTGRRSRAPETSGPDGPTSRVSDAVQPATAG